MPVIASRSETSSNAEPAPVWRLPWVAWNSATPSKVAPLPSSRVRATNSAMLRAAARPNRRGCWRMYPRSSFRITSRLMLNARPYVSNCHVKAASASLLS